MNFWLLGFLPLPFVVQADESAVKWIRVPAGNYTCGEAGHPLNPQRTVKLAAFSIADAEVTNAEFAKFVEATHFRTDAEKRGEAQVFRRSQPEWKWVNCPGANWRFPEGPEEGWAASEHPQHPVTQISAADAAAYAQWAKARLPTQAEWEVAARAGSPDRFPWGKTFAPQKANIWNGTSHKKDTALDGYEFTAPVRSFPPNAWGLYDVIGNVFEYVSDLPVSLALNPESASASPAAAATNLTSSRGGSWWCSEHTCKFFTLVAVGTMQKHASLPNQGMRLARNE